VSLLEVTALTAGHSGVPAVHEVSLSVDRGEMVALLGANGAGKTTLLHTLAGLLPPLRGEVHLGGHNISSLSPHLIARRGMSLLPENRGIFYQLTVAENLRLHASKKRSITIADVEGYFPALQPLMSRKAGLLSGGEQQMLSLGCRIIADPKVLLIDEMSLGLAPLIFQRMLPVLSQYASERGTAVLLVEQHVHLALKSVSRAYVLNRGNMVFAGSAVDLQNNQAFLESSYMGTNKEGE